MLRKARITFGLALLVAAFAVIGRAVPLIAIPLTFLAAFLIVWGRAPSATETFIKGMPLGRYVLEVLQHLDLILVPQDREYNQHVREVIERYDAGTREALRTLYRTRNTNHVGGYLSKFVADGFIEYPKDGPGWLKPELRDIVGRTLDDFGVP
jgi:hypothetical protein